MFRVGVENDLRKKKVRDGRRVQKALLYISVKGFGNRLPYPLPFFSLLMLGHDISQSELADWRG